MLAVWLRRLASPIPELAAGLISDRQLVGGCTDKKETELTMREGVPGGRVTGGQRRQNKGAGINVAI